MLSVAQHEANAAGLLPGADRRVENVGLFLITLDVHFVLGGVLTVAVAVWTLRRKLRLNTAARKAAWHRVASLSRVASSPSPSTPSSVKVTPSGQGLDAEHHAASDDAYRSTLEFANHAEAHHEAHVTNLMEDHHAHETMIKRSTSKRQDRAKRRTALRVRARQKVRRNRVLRKVPLFSNVSEEGITAILDATRFERFDSGDVICREGAPAAKFYILIAGDAVVSVSQPAPPASASGGEEKARPGVIEVRVGALSELDMFGEACLLGRDGGEGAVRNATVTAGGEDAGGVQVLSLHRDDWQRLVAQGVLDALLVDSMRDTHEERSRITRSVSSGRQPAWKEEGGGGFGGGTDQDRT